MKPIIRVNTLCRQGREWRSSHMDVVHRDEAVKCPTCEKPIHISVGRWPGGIDDSGARHTR